MCSPLQPRNTSAFVWRLNINPPKAIDFLTGIYYPRTKCVSHDWKKLGKATSGTFDVNPARQYLLKIVVLLSCAGQPGHSDPVFQRKSTVWLVSILEINRRSLCWSLKSPIPANNTTGLASTLKCCSPEKVDLCDTKGKIQNWKNSRNDWNTIGILFEELFAPSSS